MNLLLNKSLVRFGRFKVVQLFFSLAGYLRACDDAYDDPVIIVDSEETELEDSIFMLLALFII